MLNVGEQELDQGALVPKALCVSHYTHTLSHTHAHTLIGAVTAAGEPDKPDCSDCDLSLLFVYSTFVFKDTY